MTNQEMNAAVAELRGWKTCWWCPECMLYVLPSDINSDLCHAGAGGCGAYVDKEKLPDCATDLNVIAVAESELLHNYPLRSRYITELSIVMTGSGHNTGETVFATPDQRTEALLRTFGKWSPANEGAKPCRAK